jgi:hypothetical protein
LYLIFYIKVIKKKEMRYMVVNVEDVKMWNRDKNMWEMVKVEIVLEFDEKGRMKYSERRI